MEIFEWLFGKEEICSPGYEDYVDDFVDSISTEAYYETGGGYDPDGVTIKVEIKRKLHKFRVYFKRNGTKATSYSCNGISAIYKKKGKDWIRYSLEPKKLEEIKQQVMKNEKENI